MTDSYLNFANSPVGGKLAEVLGLPKPMVLERYKAGQPVIKGSVLIGGGTNAPLLETLAGIFKRIGAQTVAHAQLPQWTPIANQAGLMSGRWGVDGQPGEKVKALVFDATGLVDSSESDALYQFFHDAARSVLPCGRVVILGRPPELCETPRQATIQRALEGLSRSLAKELKKAIAVQLVYVAEGAEAQLESTLRFLLSPRSAYVSAQVVRVGAPVGEGAAPADWNKPLAGKKILVTGASRGIGASIAEVMAQEGATVICLDIPQAQAGLDDVAAKIGGSTIALDIGAADAPQLLVEAAKADGGWDVVVHNAGITRDKTIANQAGLMSGRWGVDGQPGEKAKALVFDATGLVDSSESDALYQFFHDAARSVLPCGRVVILGRPPELCETPRQATIQRALEGLSRSLAKELKKAIAVQLVYVAEGAEAQLESTLRFLLSPRSAYVSAQVVRVGAPVGEGAAPADWSKPLAGKKVLVTGASRGIGASIAEVMAQEGATVICLDIPQAQAGLDEVAAKIGGSTIALDIGAADAPQLLVDAAKADGGWDVVVHNAGITRDKTIANMKEHFWQMVVNVNLSTQERINDALVESGALKAGGRIVCVSSISGIAGNLGQTNYALSKAGVVGMVQSTAPIFAKKGITINAVAPGFIETQMTAAVPFAIREAGRRMNSMSQGGLPQDVAQAIAWFASPASNGLTGNVVRVCGQSLIGA
jgi:3-oxoacyl-[acyl-carrier protein] reductase